MSLFDNFPDVYIAENPRYRVSFSELSGYTYAKIPPELLERVHADMVAITEPFLGYAMNNQTAVNVKAAVLAYFQHVMPEYVVDLAVVPDPRSPNAMSILLPDWLAVSLSHGVSMPTPELVREAYEADVARREASRRRYALPDDEGSADD